MTKLQVLPCLDSADLAAARQRELNIPRDLAADLGRSAVGAARAGLYTNPAGQKVQWDDAVRAACARKSSIAPDAPLPIYGQASFSETRIQVTNETTLGASRRLVDRGLRPLALNFANGVEPGGGFLRGARAQEECLCRSSALYQTLAGDRMYEEHARLSNMNSTDWCILSPDVPVFRLDDGTALEQPWTLSFITCAAPDNSHIPELMKQLAATGHESDRSPLARQIAKRSSNLLQARIHRVLAVAKAFGYESLVLGAWGCGAFGNDPERTAADFRQALETDFRGAFAEVAFAITDWSPERKFLGPFRDAFAIPFVAND